MNNDVTLRIGADGSDAVSEADRTAREIEAAMTRWTENIQEEINAVNAESLQGVIDDLAPSIRKGREEMESLKDATSNFKKTVEESNGELSAGKDALEKYESLAKKVAIAYGVALGLAKAMEAAIDAATGAQEKYNKAVQAGNDLERRGDAARDRALRREDAAAENSEDPVAAIENQLTQAREKARRDRDARAELRKQDDERGAGLGADKRFFGIDTDKDLTDKLAASEKEVVFAENRVIDLQKKLDQARERAAKEQSDAEVKAAEEKEKAETKAAKEKEKSDEKAKKDADAKIEKQESLNKALERELSIIKEKELAAKGDTEGAQTERDQRVERERLDKFEGLGEDEARQAAAALANADARKREAEERKKGLEDRKKQLDNLAKLQEKMGRDDERRAKKLNSLFKEQKKIRDEANRPLGGFDSGFDSLNARVSASANSPNETVEKLQGVQDKIDETKKENMKGREKQVEAIRAVETAVKAIQLGMK